MYQLTLHEDQTVTLLSTPFFGLAIYRTRKKQGQHTFHDCLRAVWQRFDEYLTE